MENTENTVKKPKVKCGKESLNKRKCLKEKQLKKRDLYDYWFNTINDLIQSMIIKCFTSYQITWAFSQVRMTWSNNLFKFAW